MKLEMSGSYKNPVTKEIGLRLNTIRVRRTDGVEVTIDRDWTDYDLEDGEADIVFRGIYLWDDNGAAYPDNTKDLALYDGATLAGYELEEDDDLPEDYDLTLEIGQKLAAW